jgi:hypothetical protein
MRTSEANVFDLIHTQYISANPFDLNI